MTSKSLFMFVGATLVVSGDGRYYSKDAIQVPVHLMSKQTQHLKFHFLLVCCLFLDYPCSACFPLSLLNHVMQCNPIQFYL